VSLILRQVPDFAIAFKRYRLNLIPSPMTSRSTFQRQVWKICLGLGLLGLIISIEIHYFWFWRGNPGFYWIIRLLPNRWHLFAVLATLLTSGFLIDRSVFATDVRTFRIISYFELIRSPLLKVITGVFSIYVLILIFTFFMPMRPSQHCDTVQSQNTTYHLVRSHLLDIKYALIRCNQLQLCQVIARSVDENARQGEKLQIYGDSIFAISTDRKEPIFWHHYGKNGQFLETVDRLPLETP
jgi:hypothetical protein